MPFNYLSRLLMPPPHTQKQTHSQIQATYIYTCTCIQAHRQGKLLIEALCIHSMQ